MRAHMSRPCSRDRLDQRRLATSVLPDQHREARRRLKALLDQVADRRDVVRPYPLADLSAVDVDASHWRAHESGHRSHLLKMTRLLTPPIAIDVVLDHGGAPIAISGAYSGTVEPIARWKVETSWWKEPIVREYWKAVLNNNVLCELYHDVGKREWFVERIYD